MKIPYIPNEFPFILNGYLYNGHSISYEWGLWTFYIFLMNEFLMDIPLLAACKPQKIRSPDLILILIFILIVHFS